MFLDPFCGLIRPPRRSFGKWSRCFEFSSWDLIRRRTLESVGGALPRHASGMRQACAYLKGKNQKNLWNHQPATVGKWFKAWQENIQNIRLVSFSCVHKLQEIEWRMHERITTYCFDLVWGIIFLHGPLIPLYTSHYILYIPSIHPLWLILYPTVVPCFGWL